MTVCAVTRAARHGADPQVGLKALVGLCQWGGHSSAHSVWTQTAPAFVGQPVQATLMRLKAWCGPWWAGGGLSPPGTGSLHVLPGVHGVSGSWGGHGTTGAPTRDVAVTRRRSSTGSLR
jgi:hypothetical protein